MFIWCAIMFVLGIAAFLDSLFNYGEIFRQINSVVFLLVALALLIRTSTKAREQKTERLQSKLFNLEREVSQLKSEQKKLVDF